jgi:hypothetical protein
MCTHHCGAGVVATNESSEGVSLRRLLLIDVFKAQKPLSERPPTH